MRARPALLPLWAVLAFASLAVSFYFGPSLVRLALAASGALRGMGLWGGVLFAAGTFATTLVGVVPGALLGIAAGAVFGVAFGFVVAASGIIAGAIAAFALSRSLLRPVIARLLGRWQRLLALDAAIARDGWQLVALLRISPVMPFSVTSYVLGFSAIVLRDYVLGTLASLPPLLGYVAIGALGMEARRQGNALIHDALLALGALATLGLIWHLSRLAGRHIKVEGQASFCEQKEAKKLC